MRTSRLSCSSGGNKHGGWYQIRFSGRVCVLRNSSHWGRVKTPVVVPTACTQLAPRARCRAKTALAVPPPAKAHEFPRGKGAAAATTIDEGNRERPGPQPYLLSDDNRAIAAQGHDRGPHAECMEQFRLPHRVRFS